MYLFLKLCVLQAKFCWLGAVEETIFPSKASAAGKKTIQGVWGDLICRIGATNVICQKPLPTHPLGPHPFSSRPTPPLPPLCPRTRLPRRLLGNFTVSPVAGCTEVHLAVWELFHQSCWGQEQINFHAISQMLKMALESFIYALCCF